MTVLLWLHAIAATAALLGGACLAWVAWDWWQGRPPIILSDPRNDADAIEDGRQLRRLERMRQIQQELNELREEEP